MLLQEFHRLYAEMDTSGDGTIDFEEFRIGMMQPSADQTPDEIASAIFSMIDREGTGQASQTVGSPCTHSALTIRI